MDTAALTEAEAEGARIDAYLAQLPPMLDDPAAVAEELRHQNTERDASTVLRAGAGETMHDHSANAWELMSQPLTTVQPDEKRADAVLRPKP